MWFGETLRRHKASWSTLLILAIIAFALATYLSAIQRNLPFVHEIDEEIFVPTAVKIASSGNMNPGWFGNPGSTLIYPLALVYHLWDAAVHGGRLFAADPNLRIWFDSNPAEYYLLGRILSVVYAALSVLLTYLIGRVAFGRRAALLGAWFFAVMPGVVAHAQIVRTDSAGTFFALLALWAILKTASHPSARSYLLAGVAIGLAIATRYFLATLVPALLLVAAWPLLERSDYLAKLKRSFLHSVLGLAGVVAAFSLSTPYFFIDLPTALSNLQGEADPGHLGSDGLGPIENTLWYLTDAIPFEIGWPLAMMSVVGIVSIVRGRQLGQLVLLAYAVVFLLGLGAGPSPLSLPRRLIQMLPVVALFGGHGLNLAIMAASAGMKNNVVLRRGLWVSAVVGLSIWPGFQTALFQISTMTPSTRVQAREWLIQNLPPGTAITQEWYGAPLAGTSFRVDEPLTKTLAHGHVVSDYSGEYVIANSFMYGRYLTDLDRYQTEIQFYEDLFDRGHLLRQFEPSIATLSRAFDLERYGAEPHRYPAGPTIWIYRVPETIEDATERASP